MASDPETLTREHKHLVKRTKSFWKFGKNNSDCEILEGMALWRHRDLVDVEESQVKTKKFRSPKKIEKLPRDRSNDSDKTINNKPVEENKPKMKKTAGVVKQRSESVKKNSHPLPQRRDSGLENSNYSRYNEDMKKGENQFYDDEDGLMLKTVNRRNILQQYDNDDSTIMDSEDSHSDASSDDPYDCIVSENQTMERRQGGNFPNVVEIGKKLEKLSKSSKYSPNKSNNKETSQEKNTVLEKNKMNKERNNNNNFENDVIQYPDKRSSFRTFRSKPEPEKQKSPTKYPPGRQNHEERNAEDKRRYYTSADSNRSNTTERRTGGRPSYESIESTVVTEHRGQVPKPNKTEKSKYYDSNVESDDERQFLPRTKLTKTNSGGGKYEQNDLMGYGETLQRRLKNPEYGAKYDDRSPHNGNMYGPWYDLWGLDATSGK